MTLTPGGAPHATPVWIDYDADADCLLVNTARGRRKERNAREDSRVAVSMLDPEDPYRYLSVTGVVGRFRKEGAVDHINDLAGRYMGVEEYPNLGDERGPRVIADVRSERVHTS